MAAATPQSVHRDALLAANRAVIDRIRNSVSGVTADALARRPPDGGWSIAEVLEHLIISADSYLDPVGRLIQDKAGAAAGANAMWKPSFMGGLLTQSLRNPRKLPTARAYKPGPSPRARVLEEFIQRQEAVGRLVAQAGGMDWQHISMRSPVMPLLRMNLGDALTILVVHAERHAGQIERVKEKTLGERPQ
jgi:hypothetical protein